MLLRAGKFNDAGLAPAVEVAPEFPFLRLALHRADHLAIHDQGPDVGALRFFDKFLYNDARLDTVKRFDNRLGGILVFREHDAEALRSFQQLDHDRRAPYRLNDALRIF